MELRLVLLPAASSKLSLRASSWPGLHTSGRRDHQPQREPPKKTATVPPKLARCNQMRFNIICFNIICFNIMMIEGRRIDAAT